MRRSLWYSLIGIVVLAGLALGLTFVFDNRPVLGLDLQGGASVVLQPADSNVASDVLRQATDIIRSRVDALGVAEPEISRQGNAIVVELPGVKEKDRALSIVGQTAELRFRPVLADLTSLINAPPTTTTAPTTTPATTVPGATPEPTTTAPAIIAPATTLPATTVPSAETTAAPGPGRAVTPRQQVGPTVPPVTQPPVAGPVIPTTTVDPATTTAPPTTTLPPADPNGTVTPPERDDPTQPVILSELDRNGKEVRRYYLGPVAFTGSIINGAQAELNTGSSRWEVVVDVKGGAGGLDQLNALAAQCIQQAQTCPTNQMAIVLDSVVKSAPVFQTANFSQGLSISGAFSEREAKDLALVLRYGALPVKLEPQAVQTVSATLGRDSLRAGVIAGLIGVGLVMTLMVLYYRWLGLVVLAGLAVSGSLLWSLVSYLGETRGLALTLAGATGIIVSVGVTVDSYVVYFERLKEEVRLGKTLRSSAERGFTNAYRTIIAADLVSLLGAGTLYLLTVGSVRGFAFFLGLSTLLDLVVAYFFTRPLVALISRRMRGTGALGVRGGEALAPAGVVTV